MVTSNKSPVTGGRNILVGYKRLIAWEIANELALTVYKVTRGFPEAEIFGVTSQLRRAAISVVLNIVEGHSRNNKKEFRRFLLIALGSLAEVDYLLSFSREVKYLTDEDYNKLCQLRDSCGRVLWKLMKSL